MLTVLETLKLASGYLEKRGIESPRVNAEMLLAHILKCKRLNLYLSFDQPLQDEELEEYRILLRRRAGSEPVQYIIGEVEFYGVPLKVNSSVLIPRQETETLVEAVIEYCKANNLKKILDIGTGSGNIAVTLALNIPGAEISAVDKSLEALETAKLNAANNSADKIIKFLLMDFLNKSNPLPAGFDLIVSNPPYISASEFETLKPELRIFEPAVALTDNADGFTYFRNIIKDSPALLKKGGALFLEVGQGQADKVKELMAESRFQNIKTAADYLGIARVVSGEFY